MGRGAGTFVGRVGLVIVCLTAVAGVLGAAPAGAASSNRACDLLTTKQVKAALGASVGSPKPSKRGGRPTCDWKTTGAAPKMLSLAISPLAKADTAKFAELADDADNLTFDDVGDDAVLECTIPRNGKCLSWGTLWVTVDDEYLGLSLTGVSDPDDEAAALEQLGRQAAKEL